MLNILTVTLLTAEENIVNFLKHEILVKVI
jgi:hypothetical protein